MTSSLSSSGLVSWSDRQEAYAYLDKQSPTTVALLMSDWNRPLRAGCGPEDAKECITMKNIIWMWLYTKTSSANVRKVLEELADMGEKEILLERGWTKYYVDLEA